MKRIGSLLWVSVILATGTAGLALVAAPATANTGDRFGDRLGDWTVPGSDPVALLLLERAERAAYTVPYSGVRYLATWCPRGTTSAIVEISHVPGVGTTVLTRDTAADPAGAAALAGSTVSRPITAPDSSRPAATGMVARNYQVTLAGREEVAGRRAAVVELRRPRTGTLAARMWLDSATALLLRLDVFDSTGATVRAGGFIAIKVERPEPVPPTRRRPVEPAAVDQVRRAGWTVPSELPDGLRLYDLHKLPGASGEIVHASYSDGLSTVSVFAQHGRLDTGGLSGYSKVRLGDAAVYVDDSSPRRVVWAADGTVYTILTDAADETIESVLAALPRNPGGDGVAARLGRGLHRVGSWFNPFG
ncbi:MAG TPA: sigma-E factor regulatory protein RseB domain-containing protein [Actinomycetes bacterium]|nr:sigma-E factor regulatory protein RseB domain-containing protein [Actinomycetes bacterium]